MAPRERPPGLILAGGASSRMGVDKAGLSIGGETMLGHIVKRLTPQVSALALNAPADYPNPLGLSRIPDEIEGRIGPLAGVLAGLRHIGHDRPAMTHMLTVPSDSPFLPDDLVDRLDAVINDPGTIAIAASDGMSHPVFGLWPVSVADDLAAWLADPDNRRIKAFLRYHRVVTVEFPMRPTPLGGLDPFLNVNTPAELEQARRFAEILG